MEGFSVDGAFLQTFSPGVKCGKFRLELFGPTRNQSPAGKNCRIRTIALHYRHIGRGSNIKALRKLEVLIIQIIPAGEDAKPA